VSFEILFRRILLVKKNTILDKSYELEWSLKYTDLQSRPILSSDGIEVQAKVLIYENLKT
jgi:hypothetical protein